MDLSQFSIFTGGVLTVLMGAFHTRFHRLFLWKDEFTKISERNRRIVFTIHAALLLLFFGIGSVSVICYRELSEARSVSMGILLVLALFWLWRAAWQVIYFKSSKNRRLRKFLVMHYGLILWFVLLFAAYSIPVMIKLL